MPDIDYGEEVKKRVAKELAWFLLPGDKKPEKVTLTVVYSETVAKINIDVNDIQGVKDEQSTIKQ